MTLIKALATIVASSFCTATIVAQNATIELWDTEIPHSRANPNYNEETIYRKDNSPRIQKVVTPTLTVYLPSSESNAPTPAVVICPGGGYQRITVNKEGGDAAIRLAENGITAFVLKYRLPSDEIMTDRAIAPLSDAQRAIRMVRNNAQHWNVDPTKVGIMGFSAGGHLAASASVLFDYPAYNSPTDTLSARPDFSLLIYPVISMDDSITHQGSRTNLIGGTPNESEMKELMSCEKQVGENTPPAFLVHAFNDKSVNYLNSICFAEAMQKHDRNVEMHIFPTGGHGFGLADGTHQGEWFDLMIKWMKHNSFVNIEEVQKNEHGKDF